ncbi:hypothetical protein [Actinomadura miaoliensis]|uniref:class II glutamine amidotransferase n=1 Tax=Actinomadura miaoliensis TaxID=430685 RepID=UPI0031E7B4F6
MFAYIGPDAPDPELLVQAAEGAARRGPHAHGWAGHGVAAHRALGCLDPASARGLTASRLVGHARLATSGRPGDIAAIQPIEANGHLIVHNGTVPDLAALSALDAITGGVSDTVSGSVSDTVALAACYARLRARGRTPQQALDDTLQAAAQTAWAVVVLDASGDLVHHRHRLPLFELVTPEGGVYLSSGRLPAATATPPGQSNTATARQAGTAPA